MSEVSSSRFQKHKLEHEGGPASPETMDYGHLLVFDMRYIEVGRWSAMLK